MQSTARRTTEASKYDEKADGLGICASFGRIKRRGGGLGGPPELGRSHGKSEAGEKGGTKCWKEAERTGGVTFNFKNCPLDVSSLGGSVGGSHGSGTTVAEQERPNLFIGGG